jgi:DSF synthase
MEITTLSSRINQPEMQHASLQLEASIKTALLRMAPAPRPCFTFQLLEEIKNFQAYMEQRIVNDYEIKNHSDWQYIVLASSDPSTFNLGGDLSLFVELIENQDRDTLMKYARACIDGAYGFHTHLKQPVTSIALIEGNAQGGGFEAALSCNVIIAERGAHMGFPEVLFNMFPGMGAYSFLSRRVGAGLAERLIYSGDLYSAETLYELGVVDVLAESGAGFEALTHYVHTAQRRTNANRLLRHVRETYNQVPLEELLSITTQWVDSALNLTKSELSIMQRLVRAQNRRTEKLLEASNLQSLRQAT